MQSNIIVIFILSARRERFLCMKRSFTPRRRSRQYKPLNAQKHLRARNINNIFSIIKIQIFEGTLKFQCSDHVAR
jgi:hypothetical protein